MASQGNNIPSDYATRIAERSDGYYWIDLETSVEFGPFPTASQAITDMESSVDSDYEPGETLQEAEAELGIADWVDPNTGEPAEDHVPHIED
jgi:hypothetical protein